MPKPESIEALLNPSLRVSRPVAACAKCRTAKIKCDGKLPACSACERAGKTRECSSANDDFAKGKERSYVAALETTIQRLQKQIKDVKGDHGYDHHYQLVGDHAMNGRPSLQRRAVSNSKRKEASDMDELVSDFGFLTVNATSRDFHGFTSAMSFARILMATAVRKPLQQPSDLQMPSRYEMTPFVDHYFAHVYVLLPFFSETEFMSSLSKVCQDAAPAIPATAIDHWSVRMVLAISAASMCQSKGDSKYELAMRHVSAAMEVADYVIHPGSMPGIQALLLLVQYSLVDPEHFDGWYLIGMASRLLVDLGLHCEPPPEARISRRMLDLRRRVFYCTYALDRQISMAQGLPFSFTDDSAPNVLLPTLATDLEKRSPTQLFLRSIRPSLFLFDIRRVQSAFYQLTRFSSRDVWVSAKANDYISSILNDVRGWNSSIPASFDQCHFQYFYVESIYSQLLAISPNQKWPVTSMSDVHKALVFHLAIQFADQLQLMVQTPESQAFVTYADMNRVQYVGQQFQSVLWSGFDNLLRNQHTLVGGAHVSNLGPVDNCSRAITFINKTTMVLDFARSRWGIGTLREKFEQETAVLLARLQNKQQEFRQESTSPAPPTYSDFATQFDSSTMNNAGNSPYQQQDRFDHSQASSPAQVGAGYQANHSDAAQSPPQPQLAAYLATPPAMHRSNLVNPSWSDSQVNMQVPPAILPRRSYEFMSMNTDTNTNTNPSFDQNQSQASYNDTNASQMIRNNHITHNGTNNNSLYGYQNSGMYTAHMPHPHNVINGSGNT